MTDAVARYSYLNGSVVPEVEARVSPADRGLNYGDGLFETLRAYRGRPAFLRDHIRRLIEGSRVLGISGKRLEKLNADLLEGLVTGLLEKSGLAGGDARVKILVTRGEDVGGHLPSGTEPTTLVTVRPIDAETLDDHAGRGVPAVILKGPGRAIPEVKTLNYLPSVMGRAEAHRLGAFEGLFTTPELGVTEGTSSNVFIVTGRTLATPAEGMLPGVTAAHVMDLARERGLTVAERRITPDELAGCDEAFLTSSVIEVMPLVKVDGSPVAHGRPGPLTKELRGAYREAATA